MFCFVVFIFFYYPNFSGIVPICQVDAQLQVVRKLEEKERLLQGTISTAERELALRTQALDMNKRKVIHWVHLSSLIRYFLSPRLNWKFWFGFLLAVLRSNDPSEEPMCEDQRKGEGPGRQAIDE